MTHSPQHITLSADGLTDGAKRACLRMTDEWQFPGGATFNASGAWALCRAQSGLFALAERELQKDGKWTRRAYRLTPLGLAVQAYLQQAR